ncbi:DUF4145 domain-containing protein [Pseudomonas sp. SG20056]|uniref:DUF4145 domain-containing protein n=1 Tax=Pseudomonas sp. SG20056 TaxID=3074146 RepID=UPI00287F7969|nr:DUF4145 domain-containing protein [Pseudomonas sp. SG20056]WNF47726.1 DUF4145 domain-containing protein [Pseudomonas sp. SG20056]
MKLFCHCCGSHKNHIVIAEKIVKSNPGCEDLWGENHYFAQCAGCDAFTYAISSWSEWDWNPRTGEMDLTWKTYPRSSTERQPMDNIDDLPKKIRAIYLEIIGSMNAQLPILAAIGLRALIEAVCKERGITAPNLEKLIDGLATNGILSQAQASILHGHRFLGNTAAHEIVSPNPKELIAAVEIAETVMRTIYVLPELSKQITTGKKT